MSGTKKGLTNKVSGACQGPLGQTTKISRKKNKNTQRAHNHFRVFFCFLYGYKKAIETAKQAPKGFIEDNDSFLYKASGLKTMEIVSKQQTLN